MIRRGFTLIEILLAMSIVLILTGGGIAGYQNAIKKQTLMAVRNQLTEDIRKVQSNAINGKKIACVTPLEEWQIQINSNNYVLNERCGTDNPTTVSIANGVTLTLTIDPPTNIIKFKPLGQGTDIKNGQTGVITISGFGISPPLTIVVDSTGGVL